MTFRPTSLPIGDVQRRTGLSARALRLYEARGLIAPERTASGQRRFAANDLARIAAIRLLKEAGLKLSEIGAVLDRPETLANIVPLRIADIDARIAALQAARARLIPVRDAAARGRTLDLDSVLTLIAQGEDCTVPDRFAQAWQSVFGTPPPDDWQDLEERVMTEPSVTGELPDVAWRRLCADIDKALADDPPPDPASRRAQSLLARWNDLVADFQRHATVEQQEQASEFWGRAGEWADGAETGSPVSGATIDFIRAAAAARQPTGLPAP